MRMVHFQQWFMEYLQQLEHTIEILLSWEDDSLTVYGETKPLFLQRTLMMTLLILVPLQLIVYLDKLFIQMVRKCDSEIRHLPIFIGKLG